MRRVIIGVVLVGGAMLALDSLTVPRGPQVGCGELALGDSLVALYLTGKLQHAEYYESYGNAYYVEAECSEGIEVSYWLTFGFHYIVPRVERAAAVIDMKHESTLAEALLVQSNFDPLLPSLRPRRAEWKDGETVVLDEGTPVVSTDGHHKASRYILRGVGRVMMDYLTVETGGASGGS